LRFPQERVREILSSARRQADDAWAALAPRAERAVASSRQRATAGIAWVGTRSVSLAGWTKDRAISLLAWTKRRSAWLRRKANDVLDRYLPASDGARAAPVVEVLTTPARAPEGKRVYAIGDVHGRADLLRRLLADIQKDALGGNYVGRPILVFLGDYIDRGFQSREVIDILLSDLVSPFDTYFLKGNHEAAMLQFMSEPGMGPRWVEHGGAETLVSYGVRPPRSRTATDDWAMASQELKRLIPREHLEFLMNLQINVRLGDYLFVHAGVRPGVELDDQSEYDMLWIREEFLKDTRPLGMVVVHGHTPAERPHRDSRRVGIDTGAYLSGQLTAARFEHEAVEFLSTSAATAKGAAART
jgi:serine/threonine protein phosphatase 1